MRSLDRRGFGGVLTLAGSTLATSFARTDCFGADNGPSALNRFPRMMQEFLVEQVRAAHNRSVDYKQSLKTKEDAERYVQEVRDKISMCFGPRPEKTPLNARVTGVLQRDEYLIEKIIFESRPKFYVTANLYLPTGGSKCPGVVATCGHSSNGKAAEPYQSFAQGLARQGYACLIYDPIGQGERLQYVTSNLSSQYGSGTREHIQAGNQQFLVDEFLGMWRAWDGIRALDYLLTRPEVDSSHLGVTGNSGGGTMTTWLCGVEDRWTMAAPACFVTTFLRNAENELPADTEQCPPKALALGLEHEDFLAAMAPKPIVILAKERDFFDVRGSEEAYQRLKRLYTLLGKPENISLHVGPTEHGYSVENREAMYAWFNRFSGASEARAEPPITLENERDLLCTQSGQVAELDSRTVFSFTSDKARQLKRQRGEVQGAGLEQVIRQVLKLDPVSWSDVPEYRILRETRSRDYPLPYATTYAVETEPGVFAITYSLGQQRHLGRPRRSGSKAILYTSHRSSDAELRSENWLREHLTAAADTEIFTCDVRGIGESLPNTCGQDTFDNPYGCDYFYAIHGVMLDRPYLGQKTFDVIRVLRWLQGAGYDDVELVGHGWGCLPATMAGVLSNTATSLVLHQPLKSFHSLAVDEAYEMPLAYLPLGVLQHFDLPDCYRELAKKNLRLLS